MVKSSSVADSANLDSVRKCPVDDFCMLCSAGRSRWVDSGREEWSRVGARIESCREMAIDSGRGLEGGELDPSKGACRMLSTLCDREWEWTRVGLLMVIFAGCAGTSCIGEL